MTAIDTKTPAGRCYAGPTVSVCRWKRVVGSMMVYTLVPQVRSSTVSPSLDALGRGGTRELQVCRGVQKIFPPVRLPTETLDLAVPVRCLYPSDLAVPVWREVGGEKREPKEPRSLTGALGLVVPAWCLNLSDLAVPIWWGVGDWWEIASEGLWCQAVPALRARGPSLSGGAAPVARIRTPGSNRCKGRSNGQRLGLRRLAVPALRTEGLARCGQAVPAARAKPREYRYNRSVQHGALLVARL